MPDSERPYEKLLHRARSVAELHRPTVAKVDPQRSRKRGLTHISECIDAALRAYYPDGAVIIYEETRALEQLDSFRRVDPEGYRVLATCFEAMRRGKPWR